MGSAVVTLLEYVFQTNVYAYITCVVHSGGTLITEMEQATICRFFNLRESSKDN